MRRIPVWPLLIAAAVGLGLALLGSAGAADPATDAEFTALVEHDAKVIQKAVAAVEKATDPKEKRVVERNAGSGIKSSALMVATMANARIGGANGAADAMAAGVRDTSIAIFKAASEKKFKEAGELAMGLTSPKPAADAKKIDVLKAVGEVTPKEVMHNSAKTSQFGTNAEADIIAAATKKGALPKSADAALLAHRVLAMGELGKGVKKAENAAETKLWDDYNAEMIKAGEELLVASRKKGGDLGKAFNAVNARCNACHDDEKVGK